MNIEALREEFTKLRRNALYGMTAEAFDKRCKILAEQYAGAGNTPTPEQWVKAAADVTTTCPECKGSGVYKWGACINGVMQHSGPCFRCACKGYQGQVDFTRNWGYDNFHRRIV